MAFPVIAGSATTGSSSATIPARTAGDRIVVVLEVDGGGAAPTLGALDGVSWTNGGIQSGSIGTTGYFRIYYLTAGSSGASTSVTVTGSPGFSCGFALTITGSDTSTAPAVAFVVSEDPPSLTPSWGSATTLWIAVCYGYTAVPSGDPTGYTNVGNNGFMRLASKNATAASENPSTFTGGTGAFTAVTVGIRPATNTPPTANAGPDQSVNVGATVHLDGTGSSDAESSITYAWTVTNAGGTSLTTANLTGASTSTPTFVAPVPGSGDSANITLTLTVTDTGALTGTDTVVITTNTVVLVAKTGAGGLLAGGVADLFTSPPHFVTGAGGLKVGTGSDGFATVPRQVPVPGSRRFAFRYELLDANNAKIGDLTDVESCTVTMNWLADIKRTATFQLKDTDQIDFLSNRIKPYVQLRIPPYGPEDWVEWPQGVFLLSSPQRTTDTTGTRWRSVTAYDAAQVYADDLVTARYTVAAAAKYTDAVSTLLGSVPKNITTSASVLPATLEWPPGTSKLKIINELLSAVNYESLSFDEDGIATVRPYRLPSQRPSEFTYADNAVSVMLPTVTQDLDLFSVPNSWVLVVSNPDQSALTSTYTNSNPASPTSTVRRGRTIVDFRTQQNAADQGSLDALVSRLAFEASQVYEAIQFETGLMPIHSGNDAYRIEYSPMAIAAQYSEHGWVMELGVSTTMKHNARRVVTV